MDTLEMFSATCIMAGQSNTQHEIKELNNTLRQIAAAKGIKIKSLEEIKQEEEKKKREQEEIAERTRIELKARLLGITCDECRKLETRENVAGFISFIISGIISIMFLIYVPDAIVGEHHWSTFEAMAVIALCVFLWVILYRRIYKIILD